MSISPTEYFIKEMFKSLQKNEKLLFICACCREMWEHMVNDENRKMVENIELYAEGKIHEIPDLEAHWKRLYGVPGSIERYSTLMIRDALCIISDAIPCYYFYNHFINKHVQYLILSDLITFPQFTLNGADENAKNMAIAIHMDRTYEDMPILADALEECGYKNDYILDHLRKSKKHVHGCWALREIIGGNHERRPIFARGKRRQAS